LLETVFVNCKLLVIDKGQLHKKSQKCLLFIKSRQFLCVFGLMTTISMRQKDIRPAPARIEFKGMKFLITDRPSDATIQSYLMVSVENSVLGVVNEPFGCSE
jgi:hypothetical protein